MDDTPTHIDLFSGIGGFALAARWAGIETVAFCEIEPFAHRVLRKNFPGVPIIKDVRDFPADEFQRPFILTGGYPCQPFSQAGKRRGEEDDRHLWPAMFEIIRSCRPDWVLAENVAGHVSMGLDEVLSDLESEGYTTQPLIIPACAVDAPHRRDRVWIMAHAKSKRNRGNAREIISEETKLQRGEIKFQSRDPIECSSKDVADSNRRRRKECESEKQSFPYPSIESESVGGFWIAEPDVGRVAHGIPSRVDRLRGLGNAIVPQVAFEIINAMIVSNGTERRLPQSRNSASG